MTKNIRRRRANYFALGTPNIQIQGLDVTKANDINGNPINGNPINGATKNSNGLGAWSGAISAAGNVAGGLLSNGLSTGAGSAMQSLGTVASAIPGPLGTVIGAGFNVLGGLVNGAFGSKINKQAVAAAEAANTQQSNLTFDGNSNSDLLSQSNFGQLGQLKKSDIGKDGWFSRKAKKLTAQLNAQRDMANQQAISNYNTAVNNMDTQNDQQLLANYAALGGPITMRYNGFMSPFGNRFDNGGNTHGGIFTNGVTFIDPKSGSHEANPYDGVQLGTDQQGVPNLVEGGEAIYNDYVFSERMNVPKAVRQKYKLRGKKNASFADAAEQLSKESKERPNDLISKAGLDYSLNELSQVQEDEKFKKKMRDPNYRAQVMQQLAQMQALQGQSQEPPIGQGVFAYGGRTRNANYFDEKSFLPTFNYIPKTFMTIPATIDDTNNGSWDMNTFSLDDTGITNSNLEGNIPYNKDYSNGNLGPGITQQQHDAWTKYALTLGDDDPYWAGLASKTGKSVKYLKDNFSRLRSDGSYGYVSMTPNWLSTQQPKVQTWNPANYSFDASIKMPGQTIEEQNVAMMPKFPTTNTNTSTSANTNNNTDDTGKPLPTWMRYAPVFASGALAITDALGLTNKPDYGDADAVLDAASNTGYTPIAFDPIGDYLTYRPFDRNYYINRANANQAAARRALVEQSAGNRAAATNALLASNYGYNLGIGELARQADDYNNKLKEQVATFNRATNMYNHTGAFDAAKSNQSAAMNARNAFINAAYQAALMRQKERLASDASRSANITNLVTGLANIGKENFYMNQVNSNPALVYKYLTGKKGWMDFTPQQRAELQNANK